MSNNANKGGLQRVNPLGPGFTRGPARVLIAPYTYLWPTKIGSVINLEEEANWKNEKQKIEKFPEEPTEGTFYLGFGSYPTKAIKYNATQAEIQEALEGLPTIGTGGITVTSTKTKKLTEEAMKYEFAGELKNHSQPLVQVLRNTCKKTSVVQALVVSREQAGFGQYDPVGEWTELGATKGGVKITRNNTESLQDIDQIQAAVASLPDEWEMTVEAPLAETNEENIAVAWEGSGITVNATNTPNENILGFGNPLSYTERRLAIIHRITLGSNKNQLKAFFFRKVLRSATASTIDFMKTGNMATINTTFRVFADATVGNPEYSMGEMYEQNYF
jgi:hypothetical protein